jgi:hypothetical protein
VQKGQAQHPFPVSNLLIDNIAKDASLLGFKVLPCGVQFLLDQLGNNGKSNQLRMGVLQ